MKYADRTVPMAAIQIVDRWTRCERRSQPKIHRPEERGLEEEGEQALDGQRGAEDVAHEPAVAAPVHPELELLDDAGHHADGEVDQEQLPEEPGEPQVLLLAGPVPGGLEPGDREREADGQRDEQEVVDGGDPELPPREHQRIHGLRHSSQGAGQA